MAKSRCAFQFFNRLITITIFVFPVVFFLPGFHQHPQTVRRLNAAGSHKCLFAVRTDSRRLLYRIAAVTAYKLDRLQPPVNEQHNSDDCPDEKKNRKTSPMSWIKLPMPTNSDLRFLVVMALPFSDLRVFTFPGPLYE